jgi:hypothetical protein
VDEGGQPLSPPMTITVGPGDRIIWGEYNSAFMHNLPIRIYVSDDGGRSYQVARVFERGDILHVHSLVYDAATGASRGSAGCPETFATLLGSPGVNSGFAP